MRTRTTRRRMSRLLLRYFTVQFLGPLVLCIAGFAAFFLLIDLLHYLQDFLEANAPVRLMLRFFWNRLPANMVNVLPMAVLLSACYTTGLLARHHELTAVRGAGVSLLQAFAPLWSAALLLVVFDYWLAEGLVPHCNRRAALLEQRLTGGRSSATEEAQAWLAFRNASGDRDWFFERFVRHGQCRGVVVKQFRGRRRRPAWELRAETAQYEKGIWRFTNGLFTEYDDRALPVTEVHFKVREMPELSETPAQILNSLRPAEDLTMFEMLSILRYHRNLPATTQRVFETTLWFRLVFPWSCIVAALLGAALTSAPERSGAVLGFTTALLVMLVYFVVVQLAVLFGKAGLLPPALGGALPTVVFGLWSWREMLRRR